MAAQKGVPPARQNLVDGGRRPRIGRVVGDQGTDDAGTDGEGLPCIDHAGIKAPKPPS
jgi:hypothetical protein